MDVEGLKKRLEKVREEETRIEAELAAAEAITRLYPDAVEEADEREWRRTFHVSATVKPDRVDPMMLAASEDVFSTSPRFVPHALYTVVPTNKGEARIYSAARVDIIEGFRRHYESGVPLAEALLSTSDMAGAAWAAHKADREERERKREEEARQAKLAEDLKKAQPVRIVSEPAPRTN